MLWRFLAAVCLAAAAHPASAQAQWPQKPVRFIVPSNPGGSADVLARRVARQLEDNLKQPFVVENRPGGGALIGSQAAVRSAPDGYTLLVHGVAAHVVPSKDNPNALDPAKDFTHIAYFGGAPVMFAVNLAVPATSIKSLLEHAQSLPEGLSFSSPGAGTRSHIVGQLLGETTGVKMVHIPYKGATQAVSDVVAGHLPAVSITVSSIRALVDSGKLRPIAVSSFRRLPAFPGVPTFAEAGYPKLTGSSWFGISGPPGMPGPLVERINAEVNHALVAPDVARAFADSGFEVASMTSAEFTRFFLAEIALLAPYLK